MQIIDKATPTKPKLILYGSAGSGKTTLASKLESPILLDIEGGANFLDCPRTPQITSLDEFYSILIDLGRNRDTTYKDYKTIVIDSADWLVRLIVEKAAGIDINNIDMTLNKSNGGYGNGKLVLENEIKTRLLPFLSKLNLKGYGICLVAHSDQKILLDSEGVKTETITPKIDVNTMTTFVEWSDFVYYLKKKDDGERTLLLDSDGIALAKNRVGLSGEVSLKDNDINDLLKPKKGDK